MPPRQKRPPLLLPTFNVTTPAKKRGKKPIFNITVESARTRWDIAKNYDDFVTFGAQLERDWTKMKMKGKYPNIPSLNTNKAGKAEYLETLTPEMSAWLTKICASAKLVKKQPTKTFLECPPQAVQDIEENVRCGEVEMPESKEAESKDPEPATEEPPAATEREETAEPATDTEDNGLADSGGNDEQPPAESSGGGSEEQIARIAQLEDELKEKSEQLESVNTENSELTARIAELEESSSKDDGKDASELETRIQELETENARLQTELTEASSGGGDDGKEQELADAQAEIATLKEQLQTLETQLEEQKTTAASLQEELETLKSSPPGDDGSSEELANLRQEIEQLQADAGAKDQEIAELKAGAPADESATDAAGDSSEEIASLKEQIAALEATVAEKDAALEAAEEKNSEPKADLSIDAYVDQVAKLEAEMEEKNLLLQNQTATIEELEESRSSVQLQLDEIQSTLQLPVLDDDEKTRLLTKFDLTKEDLGKLGKDDLAQKCLNLQEQLHTHVEIFEEVEQEKEELEQQVEDLEAKLEEAEGNAAEAPSGDAGAADPSQIDDLKKQIQSLRNKNDEQALKMEEMENELKLASNGNEDVVDNMQEQIQRLKREHKEEVQKSVETAVKEKEEEFQSFRRTVLEGSNDAVDSEMRSQLRKLQKDLDAKESEIARLKSQNTQRTSQVQQLKDNLKALKTKDEKLDPGRPSTPPGIVIRLTPQSSEKSLTDDEEQKSLDKSISLRDAVHLEDDVDLESNSEDESEDVGYLQRLNKDLKRLLRAIQEKDEDEMAVKLIARDQENRKIREEIMLMRKNHPLDLLQTKRDLEADLDRKDAELRQALAQLDDLMLQMNPEIDQMMYETQMRQELWSLRDQMAELETNTILEKQQWSEERERLLRDNNALTSKKQTWEHSTSSKLNDLMTQLEEKEKELTHLRALKESVKHMQDERLKLQNRITQLEEEHKSQLQKHTNHYSMLEDELKNQKSKKRGLERELSQTQEDLKELSDKLKRDAGLDPDLPVTESELKRLVEERNDFEKDLFNCSQSKYETVKALSQELDRLRGEIRVLTGTGRYNRRGSQVIPITPSLSRRSSVTGYGRVRPWHHRQDSTQSAFTSVTYYASGAFSSATNVYSSLRKYVWPSAEEAYPHSRYYEESDHSRRSRSRTPYSRGRPRNDSFDSRARSRSRTPPRRSDRDRRSERRSDYAASDTPQPPIGHAGGGGGRQMSRARGDNHRPQPRDSRQSSDLYSSGDWGSGSARSPQRSSSGRRKQPSRVPVPEERETDFVDSNTYEPVAPTVTVNAMDHVRSRSRRHGSTMSHKTKSSLTPNTVRTSVREDSLPRYDDATQRSSQPSSSYEARSSARDSSVDRDQNTLAANFAWGDDVESEEDDGDIYGYGGGYMDMVDYGDGDML